jgi:hypothetical protein
VAATFDGADLDPNGVYEVLVVERRAIVDRTVVDFAALR